MSQDRSESQDRSGLLVVHRRYVGAAQARVPGGPVDPAFILGLFAEAATELSIRSDGDEGVLVGFSEVDFLAPVHAGDVVEAQAALTRVGASSREIAFEARVVCRANAVDSGHTRPGSYVLEEPLVAVRGHGTIVVAQA